MFSRFASGSRPGSNRRWRAPSTRSRGIRTRPSARRRGRLRILPRAAAAALAGDPEGKSSARASAPDYDGTIRTLALFVTQTCNLACVYCYGGKRMKYTVTTNLTLLDEERIEWIKANEIYVVASLDGPERLQNRQRPFADGRGSYEVAARNLRRLLAATDQVNARSTIMAGTDPDEVRAGLVALGVKRMHFSHASRSLFAGPPPATAGPAETPRGERREVARSDELADLLGESVKHPSNLIRVACEAVRAARRRRDESQETVAETESMQRRVDLLIARRVDEGRTAEGVRHPRQHFPDDRRDDREGAAAVTERALFILHSHVAVDAEGEADPVIQAIVEEPIGDECRVGRDREVEAFAAFGGPALGVGDRGFEHRQVEKRFAAEEDEIERPLRTGLLKQPIHGRARRRLAHLRSVAMGPVAAVAVDAVQVAALRDHERHGGEARFTRRLRHDEMGQTQQATERRRRKRPNAAGVHGQGIGRVVNTPARSSTISTAFPIQPTGTSLFPLMQGG